MKTDISTLPTEFRGCQWNDHWEFEAPCVVYFPARFAAFTSAGNTGGIDSIVDDICTNLSLGWEHNDGGLATECKWRGWGKRFDRRRDARHVVITGHWVNDSQGNPDWHEDSRTETYGPPLVSASA